LTIISDSELESAQSRVATMERALAATRRRLAQSPQALSNLTTIQDHQIEQLRAEIREYIGAPLRPSAAVTVSFETKDGTNGTTSLSALAAIADNLRSALTNVAETMVRGSARIAGRPEAKISRAVDLRVVGVSTGSFGLEMEYPILSEDDSDPGLEELANLALSTIQATALWLEGDDIEGEPNLGGEAIRDVVLAELRRLSPSEGSNLEWVQIRGSRQSFPPARLTRQTARKVTELLERKLLTETASIVGVLREIDLDKRSFVLRDEEGSARRCTLEAPLIADAMQYISGQQLVRVRGIQRGRKLEVSVIEPLSSNGPT
jgi:hypothetical protein